MNISQLLVELNHHDISVSLDGDDLLIGFEGDEIAETLVNRIRENKSELIAYLKRYAAQGSFAEITPVPVQESYPMSFSQRRLWILSQYPEMSRAYVIPNHVDMTDDLDITLFKKAVDAVITRHEILRTVFRENAGGEVRQWILPLDELGFEITLVDLSEQEDAVAQAGEYMEEDSFRLFDLENGPLFRASLIKLSDKQYRFFYVMHHIISDGWSLDVLAKDVFAYYHAYTNNTSPVISPLRIQYKDYANWQGLQLTAGKVNDDRNYWLAQFKDGIPVIELPSEQTRPAIKTNNGILLETWLSKETTQKLRAYTQKQEGSLFITLLSLWNVLLYRYTGQQEMVVGTAVAGREHAYLEDQIGFYVNTLALKNTLAPKETFTDNYTKVKANTLAALSHQTFPFDLLVEELQLMRDSSRSPLFDVMLTFQSAGANPIELNNEMVNGIHYRGRRNAKFDIEINALEVGAYVQLIVNYNTDVYNPEIIRQMMQHFKQLAAVVLDDPDQHIDTCNFLSVPERNELLYAFNDTKADYPSDKTIIELFEAQAAQYPDRVAVVAEAGSLTYRQLNEKANQLGHFLRQHYDMAADDLVGIELPRGLNLVTAIFGVLKAGAAYVPIDPNNPEDRKSYIKKDAACKCIIDPDFMAGFEPCADQYPVQNPGKINNAKSLVYVIYTSGSTGHPKGVMIAHHALVNRLVWMQKAYALGKADVILQKTTYSFDVSVWELLWWGLYGAQVYLLAPEAEKVPSKIVQSIEDGEVTVMHFVPSMLLPFLHYIKQFPEEKAKLLSLKQVFTSGEALSKDHSTLFREQLPWVALMNLYGPTEASIDVTYYDCAAPRADNIIPIGKPIDNTKMYVLDEQLQLVPIGVKGKLYIGGEGLARGYVNNETLTAKKFITNPFEPGQLIYDTGDVAQWLKDGNINFLGRIDDQVKIRGFRIELEEIAYHLREKEDIAAAVVLVRETITGQKELVAFVVSDKEQDVAALRMHLAAKVPHYMVPAGFVQVDKIPLNASGKTDKRKLLASAQPDLSNKIAYSAPVTDQEKILVQVCEIVLNKERISVKDNFYNLGGDSIKSIQIVSRLKQLGYTLKVEAVLQTPVLETLASQLVVNATEQAVNSTALFFPGLTAESLNAVKADENITAVYELSPLQQGIYFHWLTSSSPSLYTGQIAYRVQLNTITLHAIQEAYQQLINRHAVLRTSFVHHLADIPLQLVRRNVTANFHYDSLPAFLEERDVEPYIKQYKLKDRETGFDLAAHSLMRLKVLDLGANRYEFVWSHHHILMDGWCMGILIRDFNRLLNGESLPEPKPYLDYIHWLRSINTSLSLDHWKQYLEDYTSVATIPFLKPQQQEYKEEKRSVTIKGALFNKLKALCNKLAITQNTFLQAAWGFLLSRYNNTNDVVFGAVVSGRPAELDGIENMVGLFINTIPVRIKYEEDCTPVKLLTATQQAGISSTAHHYLNLAKVQAQSELGANLLNHIVVFQNFPIEQMVKEAAVTTDQLQVETVEFVQQTNYDFNLLVFPGEAALQVDFMFNAGKYDATAITSLAAHLHSIIEQFVTAEDQPLSRINFLPAADRALIFEKFNATEVAYEPGKTVLDLFRERVQEQPELTAVAYENAHLTYRELDLVTSRLAGYLQQHYSIQPNDLVGIQLERGLNMLIAILGILKCGGAYVPVDTEYPAERVKYIAADSSYKVCIDAIFMETFQQKEQTPFTEVNIPASTLAYAIYTSGSTGNPKGVLNDHAGLYNRLLWMRDDLGINAADIILQKTPYTFDVSVWELVMPAITGCKLVFAKPGGHKDPLYLQELIAAEKTTILHFVPSMLAIFLEGLDADKCKTLKHVVCSGEALPAATVEAFKTQLPWVRIHNLYGPTEAAIDVTSIELTKVDTRTCGVTIGKPVANTRIFIVDKHLQPQPVGVPGELLIEGVQVARGYINQRELTEQKFITSPFNANYRAYRTGDLARWLPNGEIAYMGRIDHQVKIRGNRVEPGEIEICITGSGYVEHAAVLVRGEGTPHKYLAAYVIPKAGYNQELLYQYLKNQLPEYMIPGRVVELEEFPLTSSGKLNRRALPDPGDSDLAATTYEGPRNEIESALANIWEEVLNLERVGIHDNFFRIGGDSILSIRLISKINKQFNVGLTIGQLYECSTITGLSEVINNNLGISAARQKLKDETIARVAQLKEKVLEVIPDAASIEDIYPMSDIQRGMVILSTLNPGSGMYHDQFIFQIPAVRPDLFEQAFSKLVWKHPALRTRFDLSTYGEDIQIVDKQIAVNIGYHNIQASATAAQEEHIRNYMLQERKRPFNMGEAPMWRADLFSISPETDVFLFQFYHAILDGWSVASLNTELSHIYQQLADNTQLFHIEKLRSTYRDAILGELYEKNDPETIHFWKNELADYKRLDLFKNAPVMQSYTGVYPAHFINSLRERCRQEGISMKTAFYGALVYVFKMLSYEEDFVIGMVTNNRPVVEDGDKILGCFLNTIPVRNRLENTHRLSWRAYFKRMEQQLTGLRTKERMTLYEISKITNERDAGRSPFFDVLFNYVDFHVYNELGAIHTPAAGEVPAQRLNVASFEATNTFLDIDVIASGETIRLIYGLRYLLKIDVPIDTLHTYVNQVLTAFVIQAAEKINDTNLLPAAEQEKILKHFSATETRNNADKTILQLFSESAGKNPDKAALIEHEQALSYREMDGCINQLAGYLVNDRNIAKGDLVGIEMEPGAWTIIAMLAVMKAGGVYVPVNPRYPEKHKTFIYEDSKCKIVLNDTLIAGFKEIREHYSSTFTAVACSLNDLAYIIYTSGSTGNPKGVQIRHLSLADYAITFSAYFQLTPADSIVQQASISFDTSVEEIFPVLISGGTLVLFQGKNDIDQLLQLCEDHKISILSTNPFVLQHLNNVYHKYAFNFRVLISGGDALKPGYIDNIWTTVPVYNTYGPTESTVCATYHKVTALEDSIPIGKPIPNRHIHLLYPGTEQLTPIGAVGEICLSGKGIAAGYLNRPELSAVKFVPNPYLDGATMFCTGDLGRWLPDGSIEFIGRKDDQVKIRGYRIELGEIETALSGTGLVQDAIVLVKGMEEENKRLVAYIIPGAGYTQEKLLGYLAQVLPEHMIPGVIMEMDHFALTLNGKPDKKALPEPDALQFLQDIEPPRNKTEEKLVHIWCALLNREQVGVTTSFFQLGGTSLTIIRLRQKIEEEIGVSVNIVDLFNHTTIRDFAATISQERTAGMESSNLTPATLKF
ncbi:amino acid adenylation domain-containing protein [Chitinophaga rupis]|uniref:Amino acid adenylation domain-containing protein n=1 Tax=Chitinophaga rupis TaxID=573321 RepID=A0A1H8B4Y2_9BACT|nr:non-ribosomal peptide synthetase [Chitinophaga rupis]SEM77971.1 amino acid adenylation domain-containing protein [Chitinophaga rupis]